MADLDNERAQLSSNLLAEAEERSQLELQRDQLMSQLSDTAERLRASTLQARKGLGFRV